MRTIPAMTTIEQIISIEHALRYLAHCRAAASDDVARAADLDGLHQRFSAARSALAARLTIAEDIALELAQEGATERSHDA